MYSYKITYQTCNSFRRLQSYLHILLHSLKKHIFHRFFCTCFFMLTLKIIKIVLWYICIYLFICLFILGFLLIWVISYIEFSKYYEGYKRQRKQCLRISVIHNTVSTLRKKLWKLSLKVVEVVHLNVS